MNNREKLTSHPVPASAVALTDLALRYFPRSASEQLRRWMRLNPDLRARWRSCTSSPASGCSRRCSTRRC